MTRRRRALTLRALCAMAALTPFLAAAGASKAAVPTVGRISASAARVSTGQVVRPAGRTVSIEGQPLGITIRPGGRTAAVAVGGRGVAVLDLATSRLTQVYTGAGSMFSPDGLVYSADGRTLYSSDAQGGVNITQVAADGTLVSTVRVDLRGDDNPYPQGLGLSADGRSLYVALSRHNALGVLDLRTLTLRLEIPVGVAPHSVVVDGDTAYVTNEGGRRPVAGDASTNTSADTEVVSDPVTGGAVTGSVSVVNLVGSVVTSELPVGLHPTALLKRGYAVYVVNTNSDSVSVIDSRSKSVVSTIPIQVFPGANVGSTPTSVSSFPGGRLAVALGRENAVAVIDADPARPAAGGRLRGLVPVGYYPAALASDPRHGHLLVANENGWGSVAEADRQERRRHVQATLGSISVLTEVTGKKLNAQTARVAANNGWAHRDTSAPRPGVPAVPVPAHIGEPSLIKHVVLVIKENRTYDQVLGDVARGRGEPAYAIFGRDVTPNQHKLAATFPLLDNFYAIGEVSNDGHNWVVQGGSPDYIERALPGGFRRSSSSKSNTPPASGYDSLAYLPGGFLWTRAIDKGLTVADFGEYTGRNFPPSESDNPLLNDVVSREYPGFELDKPDQLRAEIFNAHLQSYEATGSMPDLTLIWLPNDHTGGSVPLFSTPADYVRDNDVAVGRVVDAISHSTFWKDTAVFVEEDDAQAGPDHVDGHRTLGFVASPYAKRGVVDSHLWTQADMLRTIEHILGLQPMSRIDQLAKPMRSLFTTKPDLTPYDVEGFPFVPAAHNLPLDLLTGKQKQWSAFMAKQDLWDVENSYPEILSRDVWYAATGYTRPFPGDDKVLSPREVMAGIGLAGWASDVLPVSPAGRD